MWKRQAQVWWTTVVLGVTALCQFFYYSSAQAGNLAVPPPPVIQQASWELGRQPANVIPVLTLPEAILLAMRQNPEVKSSELQRVIDKFALAVARDRFSPQVALSGEVIYQNVSKPQYGIAPTTTLLTPLGTTLKTGLSPSYDQNTNGIFHPNLDIAVTQPLLRGFGTAVNKADLADALDDEKSNQLTFKSQVTAVVMAVIQAYYQLVQDHNNLTVDQLSLRDDENTLNQIKAKIKLGKAALGDTVQQAANMANRKLAISNDQNKIAQGYQNLLAFLGLDPQAKLNIDEKIQLLEAPLPSLDQSLQMGIANNIDYQQSIIHYQKSVRAVMKARDNNRWQLDATAHLNQPLSGSKEGSFSNKRLTLDFSMPIRDRDREKSLLDAKITLQKIKIDTERKKSKLVTDIMNSYHYVESTRQQVKLSENSVALAQKSLEVAKIKFKYGRATTFELTYLQSALTAAQLNYISQQLQYLYTVEDFYQILGTTLKKWGVVLSY